MRTLAKRQCTNAAMPIDTVQDSASRFGAFQESASRALGVFSMPSTPACLLSGVVVSSIGLGFVMGSLRADASDDSFQIVQASFQAGRHPTKRTKTFDGDLLTFAAALPDRALVQEGIAPLQLHLDSQRSSSELTPDLLAPAIGRMKSEIIELRVLFKRLADVAELYDGEFDLDFEALDEPPPDMPEAELQEDAESALPPQGEDTSRLEQLSVHHTVDELALSIAQLDHISEQTERMKSIFLDRSSAHDRRITEWPLQGGRVTSRFGHRTHPVTGLRQLHRGMDFSANVGTPILAMADGIVAFSGLNGSYGNLVELEHGDGYRTRYAHNEKNIVEAGQRVLKGQQIALLGSTGRSTGPHVHVEVRREGAPLDPAIFLR